MKNYAYSIPLIVLLVSGCVEDTGVNSADDFSVISTDEYAVLASVVDSLFRSNTDTLVIIDSTSNGSFTRDDSSYSALLQYVSSHITDVREETVQDFIEKNRLPARIQKPSSIYPSGVLSSTTSRVYPVIQVSRVGLSTDGNQALVYVALTWGPLAGSGSFFLLSNDGGKWRIDSSVMIWIS